MTIAEMLPSTERSYVSAALSIQTWEDVAGYFDDLAKRDVSTPEALWQWLLDRSELEAALQEDVGWRYIRMTCDTTNEALTQAYTVFVTEIQPKIAPVSHQLDMKLLESPALSALQHPGLEIAIRQLRKRTEIFREENVALIAEMQTKEQQFGAISGAMTVEVDGKTLTLQQAANYLESNDRAKREEVYRKILDRRLQDRDQLDQLFNELVKLRHTVARNAGFDNYRDYMFAALGRFDYDAADCERFHAAVEKGVVSLVEEIERAHRDALGLDTLRPWDLNAEKPGQQPLRPSTSADDLMEKTIACFTQLSPFLGDCMQAMRDAKRVDLDSRIGKAPGGYNYPLYETGMPFIFMNSTNNLRDMVTIVHEGGHAVHSIVDKPLELVDFKNLPSEVAELASMSMELMSMGHWHHYFADADDLKRAKKKHLQDVLKGLPWIAAVDAFQHWIYLHPEHTADERRAAWTAVHRRFTGNSVNWEGLDDARSNLWQKQLHIFEVPFYYIEYGFAQLGAIAVWRNFSKNPQVAVDAYLAALRLGYTRSIGEIYKTAGVRFDFAPEYVQELCAFVKQELQALA